MLNALIKLLGGVTQEDHDAVVVENGQLSNRTARAVRDRDMHEKNYKALSVTRFRIKFALTKNKRAFYKFARTSDGKVFANSTVRFDTEHDLNQHLNSMIGEPMFNVLVDVASYNAVIAELDAQRAAREELQF